jgi:type IV pilus assembly protein PilP
MTQRNLTSWRLALCAGVLLVAGCGQDDMSDLEQYAQEVLARRGGQIAPLPPIKPYEPYLYQSADQGLRDPFQSFTEARREQVAVAEATDTEQQRYTDEIQTHVAEELENYPLDSLRMVGVLENQDELWGIIRDPSGTVHRVQVGNYMGTNYGKIMSIAEAQIELREIVQDSQGRWEERAQSIALSEE